MATATLYHEAWSKDPDERSTRTSDWADVTYQDWTADPIQSSTWIVDEGSVQTEADSFLGTVVTVTFSNGANAERSVLRNRVTTQNGNIFDRSFVIGVREF